MKVTKKIRTVLLASALLISLIAASVAVYAYDGTTDPIISLSYLEQYKTTTIDPHIAALNAKVTELEGKLDQLLASTPVAPDTGDVPGVSAGESVFTVLELRAGQRIMCGESCELILRAGSAAVVLDANSLGGISDLTAAKDLAHGMPLTANHLLLVPRNDGRGVVVMSEIAYIMVRGAYTVE